MLVISKPAIPKRLSKFKLKEKCNGKEIFKECLLREDSIKHLYQIKLENYTHQRPISNNIIEEWEEMKNISTAAMETLGKRWKRHNKRGLKVWNDENAQIIDGKKQAYLKYLNKKTPETEHSI
jgi:hypothetical protein